MSFLFGGNNDQPNIVIPPAETPRAFQTIIPQKSYKDLAESMGRTEGEYNRLLDTRYDMTGTAAQLGAKQRGIEMQEAASYASSLPKKDTPDTSFRGTPREFQVTSNTQGTFDTAAGQKSGTPRSSFPSAIKSTTGTSTTGTSTTGTSTTSTTGATRQVMPTKTLARQAAEKRYGDAKDYYLAAVEKAKKTPRSYMPLTKDPGFAQNDASIYLPKKTEEKK
tara:strand:- start:716 stop:1378 length:663 start_codon:yes stop_codon:yes gene_type:complete